MAAQADRHHRKRCNDLGMLRPEKQRRRGDQGPEWTSPIGKEI